MRVIGSHAMSTSSPLPSPVPVLPGAVAVVVIAELLSPADRGVEMSRSREVDGSMHRRGGDAERKNSPAPGAQGARQELAPGTAPRGLLVHGSGGDRPQRPDDGAV